MSNNHRLRKFEDAFEKGLQGNVENYDLWLKQHNINPNKLTLQAISQFFLENPDYIVDIDNQLNIVAEYCGYYSREKKDLFYLPLIGVHGSGRTLFLKYVENIIKTSKKMLNILYIDAAQFENENYWDEFYSRLDQKFDILLIDNNEKYRNIVKVTEKILHKIHKGIVISAWVPEFYLKYHGELEKFTEYYKEIHLEPFHPEVISNLIQSILSGISLNQKVPVIETIFSKNTDFTSLREFSQGIPLVFISVLFQAFKESFLQEKELIDGEAILNAISFFHIPSQEILTNLTDIHKIILLNILKSSNPAGIQPLNLLDPLQVNKATISYHLTILREKNLLIAEKTGRSVFYTIPTEIKPVIQLYLDKNGEFLA